MKINVKNNLPDDVEVHMTQTFDGSVTIILSEAKLSETKSRILGDAKPGEVVKIGDREYIVLEHDDNKTLVITKEFVTKKMSFGNSSDYKKSEVRKYVTETFYAELCNVVGKENIYSHKVNLMCDDGSNKNDYVEDFVSILTTEEYRRYRELIPAYGDWWWTASATTVLGENYFRGVCYVGSHGIVNWVVCGRGHTCGVRPFCILNSSIPLSD